MPKLPDDEWKIIYGLLPKGWQEAARSTGAFRRARYITDPGVLLRLLLFHAVHDGGLRETVGLARAGGLVEMSQVALLKRLRTSGDWLSWIARETCTNLRASPRLPGSWRIRAIDSTSISGPMSTGTDWRVHYAINLSTLDCDWHEVTDVHGGELLERTPIAKGDLILADRNYLRLAGLEAVVKAEAQVLIRLRWSHLAMSDASGRPFKALRYAKRLKAGQVGDWPVMVPGERGQQIRGRVVALRLPRLVAERSKRRVERTAMRKSRKPRPNSLEAANYVMLFTTVPKDQLSAGDALELYRCRWQIELAFKRLKQLLNVGRLPHQDQKAARTWILAKLLVALLIEQLLRNARVLSPWGYSHNSATTAA